MNTKKILVIGASGMLGNAVTRYLINNNFLVTGTVRSIESINSFPDFVQDKIIYDLDINEFENVIITPHIGSRTYESVQRQGLMAVENLIKNI